MKFIELLEQVKRLEENKRKIILAKCGAFFVAIGRDALILEQNVGLKLTCVRPKVCKIGIPANSIMLEENKKQVGINCIMHAVNLQQVILHTTKR